MRGHIRQRGNKYAIVVDLGRDELGKRKQKWFSGYEKKRDAEKALPDILKKLQEGPYIEPASETLGEYMASWLQKKKTAVRPATWSAYAWLINTHLIPNLGNVSLQKLKSEHIHTLYHQKLLFVLSVASIKKLHVLLSAALESLRIAGKIPVNPAASVELPKGRKSKFDVWTEEQLELFLEEAKQDQYFIAFELAASTGMRKSELLGLPRTEVHNDATLLSVKQAYTKGEDGYEIDDTKTDSSVRPIPLFEASSTYLREHLAKQAIERESEGYQDHGLVLQTSNGTPIGQRNLMRNFYRIIKNVMKEQERRKLAGEPYVEFKPIRFHDLRHTHATILLKNGVHPKIVQERLGHSSIMVTLNTYSHVIPNMQEAVLKGIGTSITSGKHNPIKSL